MKKTLAVLLLLSAAALYAADTTVIQYDCIPNYANWGGVTALYKKRSGVTVPPDLKGSSVAMAAIEKERANPQADTVYYSGAIGVQAAQKGLHAPYKPKGWEKIPATLKDPNGLWWTVHTGTVALVINRDALGKRPMPTSWADLLKPVYKGMIAYDDPTWGGTSYTFVYGINILMGGSRTNFGPGLQYLKKLDANVITYPRESIYNSVLSGEIPIWINADGNGYKMRHQDKKNVVVVIPKEGSFSMPLVMALVKGAPRAAAAKKYLDWLLTNEAQAEMSRGYFRPVINNTTAPEITKQFLPASAYRNVRDVSLTDASAAADALKKAWLEQVRGQR